MLADESLREGVKAVSNDHSQALVVVTCGQFRRYAGTLTNFVLGEGWRASYVRESDFLNDSPSGRGSQRNLHQANLWSL